LPKRWMPSIQWFNTPRSRPSERAVHPALAAVPRVRPRPCTSQRRQRPRPRLGRAARRPLRPRGTRRPRRPISLRPQRLAPQRPGRLQTGPAPRNKGPHRNTSPRRQRPGRPRIGSKGVVWRQVTARTRACLPTTPTPPFNQHSKQSQRLLKERARRDTILKATIKPPRFARSQNPIRASLVHLRPQRAARNPARRRTSASLPE
jgi:hypothetical protein